MSSGLKRLSIIYARFWVMDYEENVWKSETKQPSEIMWCLLSNPPLHSRSWMPLEICFPSLKDLL